MNENGCGHNYVSKNNGQFFTCSMCDDNIPALNYYKLKSQELERKLEEADVIKTGDDQCINELHERIEKIEDRRKSIVFNCLVTSCVDCGTSVTTTSGTFPVLCGKCEALRRVEELEKSSLSPQEANILRSWYDIINVLTDDDYKFGDDGYALRNKITNIAKEESLE